VPLDEIVPTLTPLLEHFHDERLPGESFGDFCHRQGAERLQGWLPDDEDGRPHTLGTVFKMAFARLALIPRY
jgi:hypothetical protein